MDQEENIRILIADDHATVREGLVVLLNPRHHLEVVAEAADGLQAIDLYRQHQPDITLMDMRMPRMDGVTAIKAIVSEFPAARIILLTAFDGEEENARQAGAKGFVLKEASRD